MRKIYLKMSVAVRQGFLISCRRMWAAGQCLLGHPNHLQWGGLGKKFGADCHSSHPVGRLPFSAILLRPAVGQAILLRQYSKPYIKSEEGLSSG